MVFNLKNITFLGIAMDSVNAKAYLPKSVECVPINHSIAPHNLIRTSLG